MSETNPRIKTFKIIPTCNRNEMENLLVTAFDPVVGSAYKFSYFERGAKINPPKELYYYNGEEHSEPLILDQLPETDKLKKEIKGDLWYLSPLNKGKVTYNIVGDRNERIPFTITYNKLQKICDKLKQKLSEKYPLDPTENIIYDKCDGICAANVFFNAFEDEMRNKNKNKNKK